MKYIVDVKDISYGRVEIEAESIEEAQEKAEELYFSGMVPWADCDVSYEACPDYRAPAYYDRNGNEIKEGMRIVFEDGKIEQVYATSDAQGRQDLGISATNEAFLKNHPDWEQEFYSLSTVDLNSVEISSADREKSAMSLNVAEGHFEYVIWSNEYLDWANWHEAFEEDYSDASDEKKYQLMSDLNAEYLEDERREMDVQVGTPIIVIADIGRWDGRHTGYREIESGCLKDCLYTELDGVTWYVDNRGDFRMDGYHHDGHNYYLYRRYRDDATPEAIEEFQGKILDHTLTEEDIDRVTVRLGDDIAKIYGFTLPDQAKAMKERNDAR